VSSEPVYDVSVSDLTAFLSPAASCLGDGVGTSCVHGNQGQEMTGPNKVEATGLTLWNHA